VHSVSRSNSEWMVGYPHLTLLDIVLIEPQPLHAVGVDDTCTLSGSITLHSVAAFRVAA
jgi:hypothetical protein